MARPSKYDTHVAPRLIVSGVFRRRGLTTTIERGIIMVDNRIAYGLAKKYGINTKGMSPQEVWEALKEKGITQENADKHLMEAQQGTQKELDETSARRLKPKKAYGFANKERKKTRDHTAHAKEMGFKNQDDYEAAAIRYWENDSGITYYGKRRDNFVKYNPKTQEYVVLDREGHIKTFYKVSIKKFEQIQKQEGYEEWIE